MAKKGQTFKQYTEEFKLAAVQEYMKGSSSYKMVAEKLDIRNCTQLKVWVKKWLNREVFDERAEKTSNPLTRRPRMWYGRNLTVAPSNYASSKLCKLLWS